MELREPLGLSTQPHENCPVTEAERIWLDVLRELEADLEQTFAPDGGENGVENGEQSDDPHTSEPDATSAPYAGSGMWRSPAQMPPLPDSLRARAEALHLSQLMRTEELRVEQSKVQHSLETLTAVPRPRAAVESVYLDVAG